MRDIVPNFVSMIGMDFIQVAVIHDGTCEFIHKKCH